jgi:hypothetical protein
MPEKAAPASPFGVWQAPNDAVPARKPRLPSDLDQASLAIFAVHQMRQDLAAVIQALEHPGSKASGYSTATRTHPPAERADPSLPRRRVSQARSA